MMRKRGSREGTEARRHGGAEGSARRSGNARLEHPAGPARHNRTDRVPPGPSASDVRACVPVCLRALALLILLTAAGSTPAGTYHTPADPEMSGGIAGMVEPAEGLQTVIAFEPFEIKAYQAKVNPDTGRFTFRGLPPGEYDLLIKTVGEVYEGLTVEIEPDRKLTDEQRRQLVDEINTQFAETEDYFNVKRIVRIARAGDRARMFVIQTRTKKVVDPGGRVIRAHIRRFDFVDLLKTRDVWQVRTSRHLLRQEVPLDSSDLKLKKIVHAPKLGRILVGEKMKDTGTINLHDLKHPGTRESDEPKPDVRKP